MLQSTFATSDLKRVHGIRTKLIVWFKVVLNCLVHLGKERDACGIIIVGEKKRKATECIYFGEEKSYE